MTIQVKWDGNLAKFEARLRGLEQRFPKVLPRIINQVGNKAKTQVVRSLTKQTGLLRPTIVKAVGEPKRAHAGRLSYEMTTRGGDVRLKYFQPRETNKGVSAKPFGKRSVVAGTFMKGGAFPNRKDVAKFSGGVFRRLNPSGTRITQVRSGVVIPDEMVSGATLDAFEKTAAPLLKQRVEAALEKLLGG